MFNLAPSICARMTLMFCKMILCCSGTNSCSTANLDHPLFLSDICNNTSLQVHTQEGGDQCSVSGLRLDRDEHHGGQAGRPPVSGRRQLHPDPRHRVRRGLILQFCRSLGLSRAAVQSMNQVFVCINQDSNFQTNFFF